MYLITSNRNKYHKTPQKKKLFNGKLDYVVDKFNRKLHIFDLQLNVMKLFLY